jgi:hypothetical protein
VIRSPIAFLAGNAGSQAQALSAIAAVPLASRLTTVVHR